MPVLLATNGQALMATNGRLLIASGSVVYNAQSIAELDSAYMAAPLTGATINLQAGDHTSEGRWTPSARSFTGPLIVQSAGFVEDADPTASTRPAIIAGVDLPASAQNITLQGLEMHSLLGAGVEAFDGVVKIKTPSTNITIRQNEIWSRDFYAIWDAGDFIADNSSSPSILEKMNCRRGVHAMAGTHTRLRVNENYIHDVARGASLVGLVEDGGGAWSQLNGNWIEDVYSNFTTVGGATDGLEIYDNRMMHVWAAAGDNTSGSSAHNPHSSTGLSFDAPADPAVFQNVEVMGNFAHVGWRRTKYHRDQVVADPTLAATGAKFNDPTIPDSYQSVTFAFNTIVSHGICMEFSGASGISSFNNTLVFESYTGSSGTPSIYLQGVVGSQFWNNLSPAMTLGSGDGGISQGVTLAATLDTLASYGNVIIENGTEDFGADNYFVGDGVKGFDLLTMAEALAAYVPQSGAHALTASEKKGALGTGYYAGAGSHTAPAFDQPAAAGGTGYTSPTTTWDGAVHAVRASALSNIANGKQFTLLWEGSLHADIDGSDVYLFASSNSIYVRKLPSSGLRLSAGSGNIGTFTQVKLASALGMTRLAFSVDAGAGRMVLAVNGVPYRLLPDFFDMADANIAMASATSWRIGSDSAGDKRFKGDFRQCAFMDEFIDLETDAGLGQVFASTGAFVDWGADGSSISAGAKPLVFRGNAAALNGGTGNGGDGGAFTISGGTVS